MSKLFFIFTSEKIEIKHKQDQFPFLALLQDSFYLNATSSNLNLLIWTCSDKEEGTTSCIWEEKNKLFFELLIFSETTNFSHKHKNIKHKSIARLC